jgi:signal transduction histidine kinase
VAGSGALTLGQFAHELSSLLDGSMRSIRLAEQALTRLDRDDDATRERILHRLHNAETAMGDIAAMLERTMRGEPMSGAQMLRVERTLREEIVWIASVVAPLTDRASVTLVIDVDPDAGALPAGPLGAVVMNGVRNAVAAIEGSDAARGTVTVRATLHQGPDDRAAALAIAITDTGPGPDAGPAADPAGHGLGLTICRTVASDLGGRLDLDAGPDGGGRLTLEVPLSSLAPGPTPPGREASS